METAEVTSIVGSFAIDVITLSFEWTSIFKISDEYRFVHQIFFMYFCHEIVWSRLTFEVRTLW